MTREAVTAPAVSSLVRYAISVLSPREFVINLVINTPIAFWLFRHLERVPVVGWLSLLIICGPMSFLLPGLTTFFGVMNGVMARKNQRAGRPWSASKPWIGQACRKAITTAAVVGAICLLAFFLVNSVFPDLTVSSWFAIVFVGMYGAAMGYILHVRAVLAVERMDGLPEADDAAVNANSQQDVQQQLFMRDRSL